MYMYIYMNMYMHIVYTNSIQDPYLTCTYTLYY